ncbi:unnamed protein product, partial [Mesorhabditis spiculigera]
MLLFWIGVVDLVQLIGHTYTGLLYLSMRGTDEFTCVIGAFVETGFFLTGYLTMLLPVHRVIYILWAVRASRIAKPWILKALLKGYLIFAIFWLLFFLIISPVVFLPERVFIVLAIGGVSYATWYYLLPLAPQAEPHDKLIIAYVSDMVWVLYNGANPVIYLVFHREIRRQMFDYLRFRKPRPMENSTLGVTTTTSVREQVQMQHVNRKKSSPFSSLRGKGA